MMNWFKLIFQDSSGLMSSKRVFGAMGWTACIIVLFYCTVMSVASPAMIDTFLFCCMGLLGIDSVTGIWKNKTEEKCED